MTSTPTQEENSAITPPDEHVRAFIKALRDPLIDLRTDERDPRGSSTSWGEAGKAAILERLAAAQSDRVTAHIKPLVWTRSREAGEECYIAETPIIKYVVYYWKGYWNWYYERSGAPDDYQMDMGCKDAEDGKAKAFTDLVERISPMLTEGPAIPEGWKLVPIEPTDEMISAAVLAGYRQLGSTEQEARELTDIRMGSPNQRAFSDAQYAAMLNASPSPGGSSE